MIAAKRKRKPGSIWRGFYLGAIFCKGALSHRERGDHQTGRVRDAADMRRSESGWFKNTATVSGRSLNIGGADTCGDGGILLKTPFREHHKYLNAGRIGRICLECAAIFGHLALTIRCRLGAIQEQ
jgi:hypothetical protein